MSDGSAEPCAKTRLERALADTTEAVRRVADLELPVEVRGLRNASAMTDLRPASVLIAVVAHRPGETVLLTRRAENLRQHGGQISLPGGSREANDPSAAAAALRETEEEVGLDASRVDVLGYLDDYPTGTGFLVTPVVGWVDGPVRVRPSSDEVAEVFEVPLAMILDSDNYQRGSFQYAGATVPFYEFQFGEHRIWGATAGILRNLCLRVEAHGG